MHDLIPADAIPPGSLTTAEIDQTMAYAENEKARATREAYASDWRDFAAWCAQRAATPHPRSSGHRGRVSAPPRQHRPEGIDDRAACCFDQLPPQGRRPRAADHAEGVKATLRGIRRTIGAAPERKAPATADLIARMLDLCPDTLTGKRDRALLAFGFASAMRAANCVRCRWPI